MKRVNRLVYTAVVFTFIGAVSTLIIFLAKGYRITPAEGGASLAKTGWILVKSAPDGAKTFLNDRPNDPTNASIGNLPPGTYDLRIQKEGYHEWKKQIPVKEEFVTVADTLLIKREAEIKPVTLTGVASPTVDPTGTQIAYYAEGDEQTGIWLYSLASNPLINTSRNNPRVLAESAEFAQTSEIIWSPDGAELMVTLTPEQQSAVAERTVLLSLERANVPPFPIVDKEATLITWQDQQKLLTANMIVRMTLNEEQAAYAGQEGTQFAPDENKFLYTVQTGGTIEYHVVNLTDPLPIGFKEDMMVFSHAAGDDVRVLWHTTSEHLLVVEGEAISIMELDGANKTTIYAANLASSLVVPTPNGRNIIIDTSFSNPSSSNLHSIFFN